MKGPLGFALQVLAPLVASLALAPAAAGARPASAHPVLLISIDGLRPGDVAQAGPRGLHLPNLTRFLAEGAHADGVHGVLPTVTYPSHTTLITGAVPAHHGVVNNLTFDPFAINQDGWYWYASDIAVPTLWDAARAAGLTVGNVHWPVSVGAHAITWNLPQIWRTGHADDAKLLANLATSGLIPELEAAEHGAYAPGIAEDIAGDETRGRFARRLIGLHHPGFLTVYLTALDHQQHVDGPDTPSAHAVLERIDAVVGELVAAERKAHPDAVIAVVSDHGFAPVDRALNLFRPFIDAGLIHLAAPDPAGRVKIAGWDAVPWISGGSIAVVLAHPQDQALRAKVAALLAKLQADPANGIARTITEADIAKGGGNPQAAFYLNLADGVMALPYINPLIPTMVPAPYKGMHGYFPDDPRMRSTFLLMGPGVPAGRNLGEVDMRAIAPTLARIMGGRLAGAEVAPLGF